MILNMEQTIDTLVEPIDASSTETSNFSWVHEIPDRDYVQGPSSSGSDNLWTVQFGWRIIPS